MSRRQTPTTSTPAKPSGPTPEPMTPALERVLLAATDLALSVDAQGRVVHVLARDAERAALLRPAWQGKAFADTVTPESRGKVELLLQGAEGAEPQRPRHVNHLVPGAGELPVLYSATHYPSAGLGDGPRWLALGRDLSDTLALQRRIIEVQQTMERDHWRFREAETRYRSLFQTSVEAVLVAEGASLRVQELNPAAEALLEGLKGRVRGKWVGAPLSALFAPEAAEPLAAAAAAARSIGRHERVRVMLADSETPVALALASFQQDNMSYLLVRLLPDEPPAARRVAATGRGTGSREPLPLALASASTLPESYVQAASDALVFTDAGGRILHANRAFARLAQLSAEQQAEGEALDRWLGRSGVELQVLLANLREGGTPGLLATEMRGALGLVTEVEVGACGLDDGGTPVFGFSLRDVGRRLAPGEEALPRVPASVKQLSELVGRVPLKQIVAETSDLIEKLSIEAALQMTRDNRALAAQMLGLSRQSLYVKLRRFGMGGLGGDDSPDT